MSVKQNLVHSSILSPICISQFSLIPNPLSSSHGRQLGPVSLVLFFFLQFLGSRLFRVFKGVFQTL